MNRILSILIAIVFAVVLSGAAQARTVNWGDNFGRIDVQSDGTVLTATFTFELGTFGAFVPDDTNTELWASNWKMIDTGLYDDSFDFFTSTVQLNAHATLPGVIVSGQNPTENFNIGEQAYVWVYNQQGIDPSTEWALFTNNDGPAADDWLIPAAGDQGAEALDWRVSTATVPVFGGLNDVTGPGNRTSTPPSFDIQTHTIPEPSSALLVAGALGLLGARRRRGGNATAQSIR